VVLNEPQRRHFAVLLAMLEDTLADVEAIAAGPAASGRLRAQEHDLPRGLDAALRPYVVQLRGELVALADRLGLVGQSHLASRRLQALLLASIVRMEDSTSDRIRGYGAVDESVKREVDPALRRMHATLERMLAAASGAEARGSDSGGEAP